jgi:hydrogenase nickel incorporation protein HypA/HybF
VHELALAQEIVAIAAERAQGARVTRVVLEVGKLACVLPDSLRFCFDAAAAATPVEGATLEIREVPGRARCRACSGEVALERAFGVCACGSSDLEWLSGEELRVVSMEVV